ncbi:MAG: hypothetical protein IKY52_05135, partial [Clostridia bacterium]|nr:hypothetical protein [Clostridia bacterium]
GKTNEVYTLKNSKGMEVDILTYGARIIRLTAPDKNGKFSVCSTPLPEWEGRICVRKYCIFLSPIFLTFPPLPCIIDTAKYTHYQNIK